MCVSTFYDHTTIKHISTVSTTISTVSLDLATARADTVASLLTQTYILMSLNPVVSLFFVHEGWGWLFRSLNTERPPYIKALNLR